MTAARLDLKYIAFAGDDFVQDGVDKKAEQQTGDEARDDDNGEWLLRVAADASGHGGGKKAEAGDESGHHDRAEAQEGGVARSLPNGTAFETKFVDVADENYGSFDADAHESEKAKDAGNAEGSVGQLEGDERAEGFGDDDADGDGKREFEVVVQGKKDEEDQKYGERADDIELGLGFEKFAVFAAPIKMVALRERDVFGDGGLAGLDDALEIAAGDGKLDVDVARIAFAIDERSAGGLLISTVF